MGVRRRDRGSKIAEGQDIESVHDQAKGTQNKDAGLSPHQPKGRQTRDKRQ